MIKKISKCVDCSERIKKGHVENFCRKLDMEIRVFVKECSLPKNKK